ncbi:hypothetical protein JZ751_021520 [Albula glossodonta]|uniref:Uncharacterized protein n=1 Tax=Albula glossodonta TaxID=121402 RepID=A0A8T2NVJ6_9TELE|nr:hypothetical protein JZ751_021520 [Albula glossodonta]
MCRPLRQRETEASPSPPSPYKLHSINLLAYDKQILESKILGCRRSQRDPPLDLLQQHRELSQRLQWQAAQMERATPILLAEYDSALCRLAEGLGESVKRLSIQGDTEAAKVTCERLKMVENGELEAKQQAELGRRKWEGAELAPHMCSRRTGIQTPPPSSQAQSPCTCC